MNQTICPPKLICKATWFRRNVYTVVLNKTKSFSTQILFCLPFLWYLINPLDHPHIGYTILTLSENQPLFLLRNMVVVRFTPEPWPQVWLILICSFLSITVSMCLSASQTNQSVLVLCTIHITEKQVSVSISLHSLRSWAGRYRHTVCFLLTP